MGCSEAQLAANRANAAKSTGPKTVEGKERSRCNALKHGLAGAGVALPTEDVAAIEARFAEFEADLQPRGGVARFLVRRAALHSIRMDRGAQYETATLAAKILEVAEAEGQDLADAADGPDGIDRLITLLRARPAAARAELLGAPGGLERVTAALGSLRSILQADDLAAWDAERAGQLEALLGHDPAAPPARSRLLSDVVLGDFAQLKAAETLDLDPAGKRRWAAWRLTQIIDAEVYALRNLPTVESTAGPQVAATPGTRRALLATDPDARLARRYEAAAERAFFQTLRELRRVQAEQASKSGVTTIDPLPTLAGLGSFGPPPRAAARPPVRPTPAPAWADLDLDPGAILGVSASRIGAKPADQPGRRP